MEYDVTGTLKIDTEAFEKALKEAQKKIDSFRSDLESLGNIAKEMGFPELKKSLDDVDKSLDDMKADFGKVDKSADNVTKSVDDLKKKTDNATKSTENLKKATGDVATQGKKAGESTKALEEYINQATSSAKKLTAETKKTGAEVDALQRKLNRLKLDKSFTKDFYKLVSQAEGTNGVELKPVYDQLKGKYKQYLKGKAEFDKLFARAVQRTNTRLYPSRDSEQFVNVDGRNFGYIDRGKLIAVDEFNAKLEKVDAKIEKINAEANKTTGSLEGWDSRLYDATQEMDRLRAEAKKVKKEFGEGSPEFAKISAEVDKAVKKYQETLKIWNETKPIKWVTPSTEEMLESLGEEVKEINKDLKSTAETTEQLDENFDQATSSLKKTSAEAQKVKEKLSNVFNPTTNRQNLAIAFDRKAQAELDKHNDFFYKAQDKIMKLKEEMTEVMGLWSDLEIKQRKAQEGLDKYGDGNRWSKKWKEDLKTIPSEIDKVKTKYESLENEVERLENEITKSGENYKKITDPLWKTVTSLQKESKKLGKMISEPVKKGTSEATKEMSEFDIKLKQQHEGLDQMLAEDEQKIGETASKVGAKVNEEADKIIAKFREVSKSLQSGLRESFKNSFYNNKFGTSKWFTEQSPYGQGTTRWIHEQLSTTRDFFKGFTQGFARLKKEQSESVTWMNELQVKMNELRYGSRDFINTEMFAKANSEAKKYLASLGRVSASTNQWVNQEITDFNRFSKAVQTSVMEAENRLKRLEQTFATMSTVGFRNDVGIGQLFSGTGKSQNMKRMLEEQLKYNKMGNATGVGFAGTKDFQNLNRQMQEYNRLSNVANLNTQRMGLGFEKFGQYSQKATSNIRSLSGVLRTLRTTMSMIGGMFVWEFAFQIMDSARATISAKSEMESYYKTLNMGSTEIASFNKALDNTVAKFQKMNKFQLGETISALGVEFKMSTEEMNQIMKVAPMIVNEYLRAGRSTEEAILAIKDISQGEFLRLSRETGVGKTEIKEAGWNGDNKDILSLYQALEKIGTSRHWDVFAMKAQSLNDVLLITENRMTEFVTLLSDAVTPVIVGSFNALGDAFNGASQWYESLTVPDKVYVQLGTLSAVVLATAGVFNNHLLPAIQNFGTNIVASFLGVDSVIMKEKGLAQAIAHETAVERIANIERANGQRVLNAKIMTLKSEELANKLGMSTTKLRTRYEKLQNQALRISEEKYKARGTAERMDILVNKQGMSVEQARTRVTKARTLAQRSLILAEEQGITTSQAMRVLMEEEALAEMGSAKALLVHKLGLDALVVSQKGMIVAINQRIAQSMPFVASLTSQIMATLGLEGATASLVITMGLLVAPFVALGLAIVPLIIQFAELQSSYEKVNDVLTSGQDRIDALSERKKELTKTEEKLANKTNRTTTESQQLDQTRKELEGTTLALKSAEEELAKAQQFDRSRKAYTTQLQANRYKNVKEINSELQKATGTNDEIISQTASMDKAYADMTKHLQVANYMENHRPERFEEFNKKLKEGSATQEEYNQKVKTFGNDWNEVYSQMESAQEKMADPELSGWDRFWANIDYGIAKIKKGWIEFWADPWAGIGDVLKFGLGVQLGVDFDKSLEQCKQDWEDFTSWFDDSISGIGDSWDNLWQPVTDFFNNLSVDSSFDPFAGLKGWWGDTNAWLDSIMPDISVDGVKEWFGKNVREPFQKAFSEWMKNPFGGGNKDSKGGGTATKSISLGSLFNFNFGGFKATLTNGFKTAIGGASQVLEGAGQLWSKLGLSDGQLTVSSIKQGLVGLKTSVTNKFNEGRKAIETQARTWGKKAYSGAKGVLDSIKRGIGNPARIVKEKLDAITNAIKNIKDDWSGAVNDAIDSFNPLNNLSFKLPFTSGGTFGYAGKPQRTRTARIRTSGSSRPVYGSRVSNATFEGTLRGLLTAQGFRSPSSYQFYPNHQKSVSQTWNDGSANCFDGAMLIATLGSMMGFKSRIVNGNWNGTGHSGAMVGGKLYDMTQFQRRGVFRGTQGVHFGHSGGRHYGTSTNTVSKDMHITINMNGTVYGMADAEEKFKNIAENVFVEYHDTNRAVGV